MEEYERERNEKLKPHEVEAVLETARLCLQKGRDGITFLDRRDVSMEFRRYARITSERVIDCIRQLTVKNYSTTSKKPGEVDAHVFGAVINGFEIYLKFQIVEDVLIIRIISLHAPGWALKY